MLSLRANTFAPLLVTALVTTPIVACTGGASDDAASSVQHLEEFTDLSKAEIDFPENLGRPLTMDDITVKKGFDGKSPEEVAKIVRASFEGALQSSYESFIRERTLDVHKRWTLVIANAFAKDFPAATFVQTVASEGTAVFMVATPRGEIFLVTSHPEDGDQWYLAKGNSFEPMAVAAGFKPFTPPIARAELRMNPPGIRIEYPKWRWAPLAKIATIEEGDGP